VLERGERPDYLHLLLRGIFYGEEGGGMDITEMRSEELLSHTYWYIGVLVG